MLNAILIIIITAIPTSLYAAETQYLGNAEENIAKLLKERKCIGCNFKQADLSNKDLSGVDITSSNLQFTIINNANLSKAILKNVDFFGAKISASNFSGSDLTGALLYRVNGSKGLPKINFSHAILDDAVIFETNLSGSDFSGAKLRNILAGIYNGYKVISKNDFSSCNFSNADMQDAIIGGNMDNAKFTNAKLNEVMIGGGFNKTDFSGSVMRGSLIGLNGIFTNAIFKNADLSYAYIFASFINGNFDNANFSGATFLRGKTFNHASFKSAIFRGVDLRTVTFKNVIVDGADFTGANVGGNLYGLHLHKTNVSKAIAYGSSPALIDYTKLPIKNYTCENGYRGLVTSGVESAVSGKTIELAEKAYNAALSLDKTDSINTGNYTLINKISLDNLQKAADIGHCVANEILSRRANMVMSGEDRKIRASLPHYYKFRHKVKYYKGYNTIPFKPLSGHVFSKFLIAGIHMGQPIIETKNILRKMGCDISMQVYNLKTAEELICNLNQTWGQEKYYLLFKNDELAYIKYQKIYNDKTKFTESEITTEMDRIKAAYANGAKEFRCTSTSCSTKMDDINFFFATSKRQGKYSYEINTPYLENNSDKDIQR